MGAGALSPWRVELATSTLDPALATNFVTGMEKVAPQSVLIKVPAIAASYAAAVAKSTALGKLVDAVAADEKQLVADTAARDTAYSALVLELVGLKGLIVSNATSEGDITAMGFKVLNVTKASRTQPNAPVALLVRLGKVHGKARVSVNDPGSSGLHYAAQLSTDPITGSWTELPGNGKERKLSGYPSGTKLWVRFAQVRYGLQSDWSVPVLVVIP